MSAALKGAVIGCGRMGAFTSASVREWGPDCFLPSAHAEAIAMADGADLVALCDASSENLARAGDHYAVEKRYTDHTELLAQETPDLIGLATRTIGRAGIIQDCIAAGARALHLEKPLCNSVAELAALEPVIAREDVFLTLGATRRHFPVYKQALAMARSGDYGDLVAAHWEHGPHTLYWSHPHSVDTMLLAANGAKVEAVQARLGPVEREGSVVINDPVVHLASVWFEGGFAAHLTSMPGTDWRLACQKAQIAVVGNGHSIWRTGAPKADPDAPPAGPAGANPYHEPERMPFTPPPGPAGALLPIKQLIACLGGDTDAIAANSAIKRDIVTGQKILFAILQSHLEGGRPVGLEEVDPALIIEGRTGGAPA